MIYDVSWATVSLRRTAVSAYNAYLYPGEKVGTVVDNYTELPKFIKESKDSTFIFVLANHPEDHRYSIPLRDSTAAFREWVEEFDLGEYIVVDAEEISNPIHTERIRNLHLIVMQSKDHFQRTEKENAA
jgi:hypothetical protein